MVDSIGSERDGMNGQPLRKEHKIAVAIENPAFKRLWSLFKAAESIRRIIEAMKNVCILFEKINIWW